MNKKLRVFLCDDHPIVLAGLRNLIESESDFEIIGTASNGADALKVIAELRPEVAVVDIAMPKLNGIELAQRVAEAAPSCRVLMLTLHEDRAFLRQALAAGVRGYLLKRSAPENLVAGIRAVLAGQLYIDPILAVPAAVPETPRSPGKQSGLQDLSARETEVLKMTASGFTTKEIARRLDVGVKSVETYRARGLGKLGLGTRAELVRYATVQGWLVNA